MKINENNLLFAFDSWYHSLVRTNKRKMTMAKTCLTPWLRRDLMTKRDAALAAGNIQLFQELTTRIAQLPMKGVPALTAKDIAKWNAK